MATMIETLPAEHHLAEPGSIRRPRALTDRFCDKVGVDGPDACWVWRGATLPNGFGYFVVADVRPRQMLAHRVAWMLENGLPPPGMRVLHKCENRLCCNPRHLQLATYRELHALGRGGPCTRAKLNAHDVVEIRSARAKGISCATLAERFDVTVTTIANVVRGRTWSHVAGAEAGRRPGEDQEETGHVARPDYSTMARGERHGHSKLNEESVREIRRLHAAGTSSRELARRYGVSGKSVDRVIHRLAWRHVADQDTHADASGADRAKSSE